MNNCLYFICPTDFLESVIDNNRITDLNYFYTSLGNSVSFTDAKINTLKKIIKRNEITKISFILANDNPILKDALQFQKHSNIKGLRAFYAKIIANHSNSLIHKKSNISNWLPLFLQDKINELEDQLRKQSIYDIEIEGKIFIRETNHFSSVLCEKVMWRRYFSLN